MSNYGFPRLAQYLSAVKRHPNQPLILAIGDSWFQYPLRSYGDIHSKLASKLRSEALIFDDSIPGRGIKDIRRRKRTWSRLTGTLSTDYARSFKIIMLSIGGNDVIGEEFSRHLTSSPPPTTSPWPWHQEIPEVVRRFVNIDQLKETFTAVKNGYEWFLEFRATNAPDATIVTHTYADVIPSKTPFKFLVLAKGPWIWPAMINVGLTDPDDQRTLTRWLLNSFENMLDSISESNPNFVVIHSRSALPETRWWDNEIHPRGPGFQHLVDTFWEPTIRQLL